MKQTTKEKERGRKWKNQPRNTRRRKKKGMNMKRRRKRGVTKEKTEEVGGDRGGIKEKKRERHKTGNETDGKENNSQSFNIRT